MPCPACFLALAGPESGSASACSLPPTFLNKLACRAETEGKLRVYGPYAAGAAAIVALVVFAMRKR